jgi:integral membrane sensor domain MASE1/serine phosphatase RsbU (regulator of sigma subunit)
MDENRKLYVGQLLAVAALYYGAAKLGLSLAFATDSVTAVWAPTGISLAALVLFGFRLWPGVALGAFLANAWTGVPIYTVAGITAGNTLEALVGAYLLFEVGFRPELQRVRDVASLVLLGALVSTMVSATIGTASLVAGDEISGSEFGPTWRTWWLGDMGGDLIVAPALMVAFTHWPFRGLPGRLSEAVGLAALVAAVTAIAFTNDDPLTFLLLPLPIVAAFRFRQAGAVAAVLITAAVAIPLTEAGDGPFGAYAPDDRLVLATAGLGVASLTALIIAAVLTERERAEKAVRSIADVLQESLMPPRLPAIPGVDLAVDFRPVGERDVVGGDFYDVAEADDGTYGIVVGDALGKGATAAADTALARYTLRAAAMREQRPSNILRTLNDAMLRQAPDHPCTAAYVRFELGYPGARLIVSIAGHPQPLILRQDGSVEPIGEVALPLGVRPDLELHDRRVDLRHGDALVIYTDGLTDAYAPDRVIGVPELTEALRPFGGAEAGRIVGAARGVAPPDRDREPRDDILVLALRVRPAT